MIHWVDDILVASSPGNPDYDKFVAAMHKDWKVTGGGDAGWFLNMSITRDRPNRTLKVSQATYADKVVESQFGDSQAKIKQEDTPLPRNFEFDKADMPKTEDDKNAMKKAKATYLTFLGGVMWLTQTRPDLCHAVGQLSKAASNPGVQANYPCNGSNA